jgi:DNA-binding MarR family transcriptional regulator
MDMTQTRKNAVQSLFSSLQRYERLYQFRDPNNACLFDLRINECYALDFIITDGPVSVVALAKALGIHKSNASRIARALQTKGFAEETTAPKDKRSVLWRATPEGTALFGTITDYLTGRFETILKDFSPDDIARFAKAMALLTDDAESRLGDPCCPGLLPAAPAEVQHRAGVQNHKD